MRSGAGWHRFAGMSYLGETVRAKMDAGVLPSTRPEKIFAGHGQDEPCTVCGALIRRSQVEWSVRDNDAVTHLSSRVLRALGSRVAPTGSISNDRSRAGSRRVRAGTSPRRPVPALPGGSHDDGAWRHRRGDRAPRPDGSRRRHAGCLWDVPERALSRAHLAGLTDGTAGVEAVRDVTGAAAVPRPIR